MCDSEPAGYEGDHRALVVSESEGDEGRVRGGSAMSFIVGSGRSELRCRPAIVLSGKDIIHCLYIGVRIGCGVDQPAAIVKSAATVRAARAVVAKITPQIQLSFSNATPTARLAL